MSNLEFTKWLDKVPRLATNKFSWGNSCREQRIPHPFHYISGSGHKIDDDWVLIGYCDNLPGECKKWYDGENSKEYIGIMCEKEDGSEKAWFHWMEDGEIKLNSLSKAILKQPTEKKYLKSTIVMKCKDVSGDMVWNEEFDPKRVLIPEYMMHRTSKEYHYTSVKTQQEAEVWASEIIKKFNETCREGEIHRELIEVLFVKVTKPRKKNGQS